MRLIDYLDKGAMLGADAACLTTGENDLSYGEVQRLAACCQTKCTRCRISRFISRAVAY